MENDMFGSDDSWGTFTAFGKIPEAAVVIPPSSPRSEAALDLQDSTKRQAPPEGVMQEFRSDQKLFDPAPSTDT